MTDIVERISAVNGTTPILDVLAMLGDAADEIERLRSLLKINTDQDVAHVKALTEKHEVRLNAYSAEITRLRAALTGIASEKYGRPWMLHIAHTAGRNIVEVEEEARKQLKEWGINVPEREDPEDD